MDQVEHLPGCGLTCVFGCPVRSRVSVITIKFEHMSLFKRLVIFFVIVSYAYGVVEYIPAKTSGVILFKIFCGIAVGISLLEL